jgi:DNA-directed RNA polymerase subunit RPC12/RpoP
MAQEVGEHRILYRCVRCGLVFEKEKMSKVSETRCPVCGFNVIKKGRSLSAKLIKTSEIGRDPNLDYFKSGEAIS